MDFTSSTIDESGSSGFQNDPEAPTDKIIKRLSEDGGNVDKKTRLSVVSKMYDIDGDGKLDEAEQAMRNLDKSNRGFLKKEEIYSMMNDHLKMQKDMFKMKKVMGGLVCFTVLLALSNLGTSLAAAWLSKDTVVSNGSLKDKKTDQSLSTQGEKEMFHVKPITDERRRELLAECNVGNGNGQNSASDCTVTDSYEVSYGMGQAIISQCYAGNTVAMCRDYQFDGTDQTSSSCKTMCDADTSVTVSHNGANGNNAEYFSMSADVEPDGVFDAHVNCPENGSNCRFSGDFFKSKEGGPCDVNLDECLGDLICESNVCVDAAAGNDLLLAGEPCRLGSECQSNVCHSDGGTCGCTSNEECSNSSFRPDWCTDPDCMYQCLLPDQKCTAMVF